MIDAQAEVAAMLSQWQDDLRDWIWTPGQIVSDTRQAKPAKVALGPCRMCSEWRELTATGRCETCENDPAKAQARLEDDAPLRGPGQPVEKFNGIAI